jgi:hypothetical protein
MPDPIPNLPTHQQPPHQIYIDLAGTTTDRLLKHPKIRQQLVTFSERTYLARSPYGKWLLSKPRLDLAMLPMECLPEELARPFTNYLKMDQLWTDAWTILRRGRYPSLEWSQLFAKYCQNSCQASEWIVRAQKWASDKDMPEAHMHTALKTLLRRQAGVLCLDFSLTHPASSQWFVTQTFQIIEELRRKMAQDGVKLDPLKITITPANQEEIPLPKINQTALNLTITTEIDRSDWGPEAPPDPTEQIPILLLANIQKQTYQEIVTQMSSLLQTVIKDSAERVVHPARLQNENPSKKEFFVTSLTDSPLRYILGDILSTAEYKEMADNLRRMHVLRERKHGENPEIELTDPSMFSAGEPLNTALASIALETDDPITLPIADGTWTKKRSNNRRSSTLLLLNPNLFTPSLQEKLRTTAPIETIHTLQNNPKSGSST